MLPSAYNRWQRRPAERRTEILAAARAVFGREGFARATLGQVAEKAGVSAATVSHYFGTKAALFEVMVEEAADQLGPRDTVLAPGVGGYRAVLHRMVTEKWERLNGEGTPELTLTVLSELRDFPDSARRLFRQVSQRARERLQAVLAAGNATGEFSVSDPFCGAQLIESLLVGAMLQHQFISECTATPACQTAARSVLLASVDRLVGATSSSAIPPHSS